MVRSVRGNFFLMCLLQLEYCSCCLYDAFFYARCECLNNLNIPPSHPENPPTGWLIASNRHSNTEFIFHVLFNPVA